MNGSELAERFVSGSDYFFYSILLALFIFFCLIWYYFYYFFNSLKRDRRLKKGKIKYTYAVFIPARNEDKVISNCLNSLKSQTYPKDKFDVFVIVESKDDPTIKITKKMGYNIIIRKDLVNKRTKGFALNEAYHYINTLDKKYDAIMVFDADNVVSSDYIDLLNDVKNAGYKLGMGYRNYTNASKNWVSACSSTLFAYMNQYTSKGRSKLFKKLTLIGTGYYIDKDIIDKEGEWIFTGMTEDVEITKYCYYHNISMKYYPLAQYYDEQPLKYKVVHTQHIRWVWGFFADSKRFKKKNDPNYNCLKRTKQNISLFEYNVSIYPIIAMILLLVLAFLGQFFFFISSIPFAFYYEDFSYEVVISLGIYSLVYLAIIWGVLGFVAFITIVISNKFLKFKAVTSFKVIMTYPFFLFDFAFAFLDGLFHKYKRTSWKKIEHVGSITSKDALKEIKEDGKKK